MREMLQKAKPYYKNDFERDVVQKHDRRSRGLQYYDDNNSNNGYNYGDVADDEYGFDMTEYSFKYARCQMVKSFSDDAAQQGASNTMVSSSLVVFRLCPSVSCRSSGNGCSSDYGEYVLPLDEYLYYMSVFNEAKEKHYCYWCKQCLNKQNQRKKRKQRRRKLNEEADREDEDEPDNEGEDEEEADDWYSAYAVYDDYGDADGDADGYGYGDAEDETTQSCPSECDYFADRCQNKNNDDNVIQYEDYLNCVKYRTYDESGSRLNLYVGAYCSSDHSTIKVDVFYDQFCTNYAGNDHDVNTVTGLKFESKGLSDFYPKDCVPCKESVSFSLSHIYRSTNLTIYF